jgi:hypothetical protein
VYILYHHEVVKICYFLGNSQFEAAHTIHDFTVATSELESRQSFVLIVRRVISTSNTPITLIPLRSVLATVVAANLSSFA